MVDTRDSKSREVTPRIGSSPISRTRFDDIMENIVGKRIGLYDVLYECNYKANDGHKLYRVKCSECGFETDMKKTDIKASKKCNHINKLTNE